jgi:cytochrome c2
MRITLADRSSPQTRAPRSRLWTVGLLATVAAGIGWFAAGENRLAGGEDERPLEKTLPMLPLLGVIIGIVLVIAVWFATESWMASSQLDAVARALTSGDPTHASALVTRYGCGGCHTIPGLPAADGKVGPPLAGLRQRVFIAGKLPNTADNLISWIVQPRAYSPDSAMPVTGITKNEARDVAAWLYAH